MRFPFKSIVWIPIAVALACSGCQQGETDTEKTDTTAVKPLKDNEDPVTKTAPDSTEESLFTVDVYDPKRDASKDLEMTVARAMKSKKRILLEIGGKW